jgi:hypothetical protein
MLDAGFDLADIQHLTSNIYKKVGRRAVSAIAVRFDDLA